MSQFLKVPDTKGQPVYDRWDRYKIPHPDFPTGKRIAWTRASTVAKAISDQTQLTQWKLRKVLQGSPTLNLSNINWDDNQQVNKLVTASMDAADANEGARLGTRFHNLTEHLDRDEEIPFSDDPATAALERKMLDGYEEAKARVGVGAVPAFIERTVVVPGIDCGGANVGGIAGTFDRVMQSKRTGKFYIWDFKTTGKLSNAEYSMVEWELQLAAYSQAKVFWSWEDDKFYDLPPLDQVRALVFHIERGTGNWALYPVDLASGRASLELACQVRAWRSGNRGMVVNAIASST